VGERAKVSAWGCAFLFSDLDLGLSSVFHVERRRLVSSMVLCTGSVDVSRGTGNGNLMLK